MQEPRQSARAGAPAHYARDIGNGTCDAPAVNMPNKSSWLALIRAMQKNLSYYRSTGAAALGTGTTHGRIQLADSVLPGIPVELWPSEALESCPGLILKAGLQKVANFHGILAIGQQATGVAHTYGRRQRGPQLGYR